jgi:hypothetical protein
MSFINSLRDRLQAQRNGNADSQDKIAKLDLLSNRGSQLDSARNSAGSMPGVSTLEKAAPKQAEATFNSHRDQERQQQQEHEQKTLSNDARLALVAVAIACLLFGHLYSILQWLANGRVLFADVIALLCLVAAASGSWSKVAPQVIDTVAAVSEALSCIPRMTDCVQRMLEEIRAMRQDLESLKAKTAWLPGS